MGRTPAPPPLRPYARVEGEHVPGCDDPMCVEVTVFSDSHRRYLCNETREHDLIHSDSQHLGVRCPLCGT